MTDLAPISLAINLALGSSSSTNVVDWETVVTTLRTAFENDGALDALGQSVLAKLVAAGNAYDQSGNFSTRSITKTVTTQGDPNAQNVAFVDRVTRNIVDILKIRVVYRQTASPAFEFSDRDPAPPFDVHTTTSPSGLGGRLDWLVGYPTARTAVDDVDNPYFAVAPTAPPVIGLPMDDLVLAALRAARSLPLYELDTITTTSVVRVGTPGAAEAAALQAALVAANEFIQLVAT